MFNIEFYLKRACKIGSNFVSQNCQEFVPYVSETSRALKNFCLYACSDSAHVDPFVSVYVSSIGMIFSARQFMFQYLHGESFARPLSHLATI